MPQHTGHTPIQPPTYTLALQDGNSRNRPPSYKTTASQATADPDQVTTKSKSSFDFLLSFDTHFIVDDSQSMFGSNWTKAKEALRMSASYCARNAASGFSVSFFHHEPSESQLKDYIDIKSEIEVQQLFRRVRTSMKKSKPTGKRVQAVLDEHSVKNTTVAPEQQQQNETIIRPLKIVVITNGIPTDDLESLLAAIEQPGQLQQQDVDRDQISIEFWQVGNNGPTTHFFYSTGKLRSIPSTSSASVQEQPRWKYDPDDRKKAGPSKNFVKYMATNLLNSTFLRT